MLIKKLDILNLEWPDSDRDMHIVTASLLHLKNKYNISYETKSIFNAYYYLIKYKPKMLVLSNFVGAGINYQVADMAFNMGIKVVSFISEGNFKEEELDLYLYGKNCINRNNNIVIDKYFLWNRNSKELIVNKYSALENILYVTGATGFDRYKLLKYPSKDKFLLENSMQYKKIIGIAGWAFGIFFNENKEYYIGAYGKEQVLMHQEDLYKLNNVYKNLIINNPDILFILRYHPATINLKEDEFLKLGEHKNVFISNKYQNNSYQISDLINISDLWIGYETTTALEAWLLNKTTFLINPTKSDFIRENIHKGSPIVKNEKDAQSLIDEYFHNGAIKQFESLLLFRDEIIKDVIQYSDGKNYIRAAGEVIKAFNEPDKKIKYNLKIYKEASKQIIKLILSKTLLKNRWPNLNYRSDFAKPYQEMYDKAIDV